MGSGAGKGMSADGLERFGAYFLKCSVYCLGSETSEIEFMGS